MRAAVLTEINKPLELLDLLQSVENKLGRTREVRWGPRTLDLDLIFYGDQQIDLPRLCVPHPGWPMWGIPKEKRCNQSHLNPY